MFARFYPAQGTHALVFNEEVDSMTGEKRVVRVAGLHVLLQAKPERAAIFPRSVGQGSRKRAAK
jgi:hypothetical protein